MKSLLRYLAMTPKNITAEFLSNYFCCKFFQYFTLGEIIYPIMKLLKAASYIVGFRIVVSGRLTQKERAVYGVKTYKRTSRTYLQNNIDYASGFRIMRFGMVVFKIYLLHTHYNPYFYMFKFNEIMKLQPLKLNLKKLHKITSFKGQKGIAFAVDTAGLKLKENTFLDFPQLECWPDKLRDEMKKKLKMLNI